MAKGLIPGALYKKILATVPIPCVDVVIKTKRGVLLGLRNNVPEMGAWWVFGGRVRKGERLEDAAKRKVLEETGLRVTIEECLGTYSTMWNDDMKRHTINTVFVGKVVGGKLRKEAQHSSFKYVIKPDKSLRPYVRMVLSDGGVFGKRQISKQKNRTFID